MAQVRHYPDFRAGDHYLPQMPLLLCVSSCPGASGSAPDQEVLLSGCTPDLSGSNPHAPLPASASRPPICCCEDARARPSVHLSAAGSGRLQKIRDGCGQTPLLPEKKGDNQGLQGAECAISRTGRNAAFVFPPSRSNVRLQGR